jgi:hypothetical protein
MDLDRFRDDFTRFLPAVGSDPLDGAEGLPRLFEITTWRVLPEELEADDPDSILGRLDSTNDPVDGVAGVRVAMVSELHRER